MRWLAGEDQRFARDFRRYNTPTPFWHLIDFWFVSNPIQ